MRYTDHKCTCDFRSLKNVSECECDKAIENYSDCEEWIDENQQDDGQRNVFDFFDDEEDL